MCAITIRESPEFVQKAFPSVSSFVLDRLLGFMTSMKDWLAHAEVKQCHFEAAAQFRMSEDDIKSYRYDHGIARLLEAKAVAQRGYDIARRSSASRPVLNDIQVCLISDRSGSNR